MGIPSAQEPSLGLSGHSFLWPQAFSDSSLLFHMQPASLPDPGDTSSPCCGTAWPIAPTQAQVTSL